MLQQQQDLEGQPIREAIVGKPWVPETPSVPEEDEELDLATVPQYEEYR